MLFSKTMLNTFKTCPRKYKYQFIDHLQGRELEVFTNGTLFHEFTESFYNNFKKQQFNQKIDEEKNKPIMDLINNFLLFERRRWDLLSVKTKEPVKYFVPIFQELKLDSPSVGLKGTIDRIFLHTDDKLILAETKTGSPDMAKIRFELYLYKLLFENNSEIECDEKIGHILLYGPNKNTVNFEPVSEEKEAKVKNEIEKTRQEIQDSCFEKKKSALCVYCQYDETCCNDER